MKNCIYLIGFLLIFSSCRKDPEMPLYKACDCLITAESSSYFYKEKYDFAHLEINNNPAHIGYNDVIIEPNTVHYYRAKLAAIYQKAADTTGSLHDMIFKYNVHNFHPGSFSLNAVTLKFADSSTLKTELTTNPGYTSNDFLNLLFTDYDFQVYNSSSIGPFVTIGRTGYSNMSYVKRQLEEDEDIENVLINKYFIDNNGISHEKIGDVDEFIFDYGWGDCPSGCFGHHYWRIRVDASCNVTLVEEFGNDLPE